MHLLYIHQYFSTREGSVGTRSYEMARGLVARGHRVTMVCGSGYRSVTGLEGPFANGCRCGMVDGIDILEFEIVYRHANSILSRARTFMAFAMQSMRVALSTDYDLVFCTSTPLTAALPGIAARLLCGKPFVFEIRDLWPELPKALGMRNPFTLGAMHALEWLGYRSATKMIALAPGIADGIARLGVKLERIDIVPNGCDIEFFVGIEASSPQRFLPDRFMAGDFVAVFAGAHGIANGLDAVLDAAEVLKRRGVENIKLLLVGEGPCRKALMASAEARGLGNVIFHTSVSKPTLVGLLKGADLGLQILADVPAFYNGTSPNKFFDYLAVGKPVLINYPGWLAELVVREDCGFAIPPRDAEAFANALIVAAADRRALARKAANAAALARRDFDRRLLVGKFAAALEAAGTGNAGEAVLMDRPRC